MIKTNRELAEHIAGKRVLLLNSLGKDSVACLHWLVNFGNCDIVSLFFSRMAGHPDDEMYLSYLQKRYPSVTWIKEQGAWELNDLSTGVFQSPISMLTEYAKWEHYGMDWREHAEDIRKEQACDFICIGQSKYESVARASVFYKKGILQGRKIYPIGMLEKAQVLEFIRASGTKLHPCYKFSKGTADRPSYYKMRSMWLANPEYKSCMLEMYPLLILDKYRYERLLK